MDEAQIKQLLTDVLAEVKQTILTEVDQKNSKLAAALERQFKKVTAPAEEPSEEGGSETAPKLSLKALQQQIQDLNNQLSEKEKAALLADRNAAVSQAIAGSNALNKPTLQKLFNLTYADRLQKEGADWFIESNGGVQSLNDCLDTYLNSDEGKIFLPPSANQGSGSSSTSKVALTNGSAEMTVDEQYAALQQQFFG